MKPFCAALHIIYVDTKIPTYHFFFYNKPSSYMLKLYGHFGSQPTRSVAWLLKMKKTPFEFITINPTTGETRTPQYREKFSLGLIPAIEDTDSSPPFTLSEASAIMIYLCEKHQWNDFYPTTSDKFAIQRRARINEYCSHHNESTRLMTRKVIFPTMKWMFSDRKGTAGSGASSTGVAHLSNSSKDIDKTKATIRDIAKRFQHKFLANDSLYIVEGDTPSIADLLAYPDIAQIPQIMGIDYYEEWPELEPLSKWLDRMSALPEHDDIHKTIHKIGKMYRSKL